MQYKNMYICACSLVGQNARLRTLRSGVRIPPGTPKLLNKKFSNFFIAQNHKKINKIQQKAQKKELLKEVHNPQIRTFKIGYTKIIYQIKIYVNKKTKKFKKIKTRKKKSKNKELDNLQKEKSSSINKKQKINNKHI